MRCADTYHPSPLSSGIDAFLEWAFAWLCVWSGREVEYEITYEYCDESPRYTVNRHRRRFSGKTIARERYTTFYHAIFSADLSPNQFIERAAKLSVMGRRKYYGTMSHSPRRSNKRMQFRALGAAARNVLISPNASKSEGLWAAHLWPS